MVHIHNRVRMITKQATQYPVSNNKLTSYKPICSPPQSRCRRLLLTATLQTSKSQDDYPVDGAGK